MAITKVEGIFSEMVVLKYGSDWYGIPFGQIVQIESAQKKYGLNTTNSKLIDEGLDVSAIASVDESSTDGIADMVVELSTRIAETPSPFVPGFKKLLDAYPAEWADVLTSCILP